jgi:tetratricopeptide (TPR) repeat protein
MSAQQLSTTGSKVGRARRTLGQLWQVPMFCAGLVSLLALIASSPWRHAGPQGTFEDTVASLRRGLEISRDGDALVGLAEKALVQLPQFEQFSGEVHFLAGSAYILQAQQTTTTQVRELWQLAVEHLEHAQERGVGEKDQPTLHYRLGLALYQQGKNLPRAVELMTQALEHGAAESLASYQLLLQANLKLPTPDLDGALNASQRVLEMTDDRDADILARARLQHSDLLLRKGLRAEAVKELERIGPKVSAPLRLEARLLRARSCAEEGLWSQAATLWQELVPEGEQVPGGKARVYFALGTCYRQMEPPNDVEAARAWQEALKLGGPDGQAAGLHLGELRLSAQPPALALAFDELGQALATVNKPEEFANPQVELTHVRELIELALRQAAEAHDSVQAQAFAELYRKVAPPGMAQEKLAEVTEAQARRVQADKSVKVETIRAEYRRAGQAYEQAAQGGAESRRAECLWRASRCYLAAQEPARAAIVLDRYVQLDRNEERLAEGWFALGEAFRAQGKKDEGRQAYYKCIEYPNTPFAHRARFQLASALLKADAGLKDLGQARDILEQNLKGTVLDREAHEKSLYKLAGVLMQLQEFDRASICLKEATRRYPNNSQAFFSREQLGECYRRLADQARKKELEQFEKVKEGLSEEKRQQAEEILAHHRRTWRGWQEASVKIFQDLADELEARCRSQAKPAELELTLLRRALFNIAEDRRFLAEYGESLRIYRLLLERYRCKVEALIACERICWLRGVMNQSPEQIRQAREASQEAIHMAAEDLQKMPADSGDFQGHLVWSRQDWLNWLGRERGKLQALAAPPGSALQ